MFPPGPSREASAFPEEYLPPRPGLGRGDWAVSEGGEDLSGDPDFRPFSRDPRKKAGKIPAPLYFWYRTSVASGTVRAMIPYTTSQFPPARPQPRYSGR